VHGLGGAYKGVFESITFLMHRFTDCIGFGGPEIDGLIADCTILGLSGLGHNDTSRGVLICPMVPETSVEKMVNLEQFVSQSTLAWISSADLASDVGRLHFTLLREVANHSRTS
jgi:hypothetical protein